VNYELDDEQELLRRTVREFAESRVAPIAEEIDREERFPYELVAEMAELGLMGIPIDEEYGGAGADTVSYAIAIEELTRIDSSVAITVAAHTSLGTMPIYLFGSEEQKQEWLPRLASGENLAAFGLTEPNAGSDAGNTLTRAELRDGQWVVNGSKMFITNAGTDITACVTITARTRSRTSSSRTGRRATTSRRRCTSSAGAPPIRASSRSRTSPCPSGTSSARVAAASTSSWRSSTAAASRWQRWASA
jgi:short/branched chain acyl-CoA dehydrogenase